MVFDHHLQKLLSQTVPTQYELTCPYIRKSTGQLCLILPERSQRSIEEWPIVPPGWWILPPDFLVLPQFMSQPDLELTLVSCLELTEFYDLLLEERYSGSHHSVEMRTLDQFTIGSIIDILSHTKLAHRPFHSPPIKHGNWHTWWDCMVKTELEEGWTR